MVLRFEISFHLYDFVAERGSVTLQNFALRSGTMPRFGWVLSPTDRPTMGNDTFYSARAKPPCQRTAAALMMNIERCYYSAPFTD